MPDNKGWSALLKTLVLGIIVLVLSACVQGGQPEQSTSSGNNSFVPGPLTVGGTVTGLAGSGLELRLNNSEDISISADGSFTFPTIFDIGATFDVTIAAQPTNPVQTCLISNATGTITTTRVKSVTVVCTTNTFTVGGSVSGLVGSGLVLQNNDGDDLTPANGAFIFASVTGGTTYNVTVATQPSNPTQTCQVANGQGTVGNANVGNVQVTCVTNTYTVGGTVTGLVGSAVIRNNGGNNVTINADGPFSFPVSSGDLYNVTVAGPSNQTCTVTNGTGTVGSANVTNITINCVTIPPPAAFTVGGSVAGLSGSGLVLRNNGGNDLTITTNGAFTFSTPLSSGTYTVTVANQPGNPSQTCVVTNGSGTINGANVTNINVNCTTNTYTVGGTVSGLSGGGLVLHNNGGNALSIGTNGTFTFTVGLASLSSYSVTIAAQPANPSQTCTVTNGVGTVVSANVANVTITCTTNSYAVGGSVTGLSGSGLVLRNNGSDDLLVGANGSFVFANTVASGGAYNVSVRTQPGNPDQFCTVANAAGNVGGSDIANIVVTCTTFTVGGTVSGLSGTLVLRNNGVDDLTVSADGPFTFATPVSNGSNYNVSVATQPSGQACTVTNGTGAIAGASVTNVAVSCTLSPVTTPSLSVGFGVKQLMFSWGAISGVTHYQLFENPDGSSGFTQIGGNLSPTTTSYNLDIAVYRHNWASARYRLKACNAAGCTTSNEVNTTGAALAAIGYFKASNTEANDKFAHALALSTDGSTLAVGAPLEDSSATGINGNQSDNSVVDSGAVYVFTHNGSAWSQQAYIKASNTGAGDQFGRRLALSADGNTLAVGAPYEDSTSTGINSTSNNQGIDTGAAYIFVRSGTTWSQQAYIKSFFSDDYDIFGEAIALSGDGNTLAVGKPHDNSNSTGINGDPYNVAAVDSGAVFVFIRTGTAWSQQSYVKPSNTGAGDLFGSSVTLSNDGNTLAVGALNEDSSTIGINTTSNNLASNSGASYVFIRSGTTWSQQAYIKASNTGSGDAFGDVVALSGDGNTLAVGARNEDSSATGINGDQTSNAAADSGAVYVFTRGGTTWSQQAYIKASNTQAGDRFGVNVSLSDSGNTLAVGADSEDSNATGIGGNQADNSASAAGAAYLFTRNSSSWSQTAYLKASNTDAGDNYGRDLKVSGDGDTLAVRGAFESSNATGIGGVQSNNSAASAGAVYLY